MYNRYIPRDTAYERMKGPEPASSRSTEPRLSRPETRRPPPPFSSKGPNPLEGITGKLGGLLKQFHLDDLDSGDILLILILIFLFMESDDNLELVITLGLLLLFGLFGGEESTKDQS